MKKILLLDKETLGEGVDLSPFGTLGQVIERGTIKSEEEMLRLANDPLCIDAHILLCNKAPVTAKVLDAFKNLSYVGVFATGVNNVNTAHAAKKGVTLCNVPDYSSDAVAQLVFTFILMSAGNTFSYVKDTQAGEWTHAPSFSMIRYPLTELQGKTLGILGYGNIGKKVARLGLAFGMQVLVHTRTPQQAEGVRFVSRTELLEHSDFLSLNAPLTEQTAHFINEESLCVMKPTAVLINTARGGLVDEHALARALKTGQIACACLDVLQKEPMAKDCALLGLENCLITPHIAWAPLQTRQRLARIAFENLQAFLKGTPQNEVL